MLWTIGSLMQSGLPSVDARFLHSLAANASAGQVAAASVRTWRQIDAVLSPIIGEQGFAAMLRRSRHLVREPHPWLAPVEQESTGPGFEVLQTALAAQTAEEAARGNAALLRVFHDLLASLIGASLCERLLRSVSTPSPGGTAAQDA